MTLPSAYVHLIRKGARCSDELAEMVDGTLASGVFDSVPFHPVCYLSAQMAWHIPPL